MARPPRIGILALQGAFAEHAAMLRRLRAESFEIRRRRDLDRKMDGLILPGGESTVMTRLLAGTDMLEPLRAMFANGLPAFGTCAGLILLAREVEGGRGGGLECMDIRVRRNAYGRQLGSFAVRESFTPVGEVPMVFVRAPYVAHAGKGVEVLAEVDGRIVAVRQGAMLATAFHPELTDDPRVHASFLHMARAAGRSRVEESAVRGNAGHGATAPPRR